MLSEGGLDEGSQDDATIHNAAIPDFRIPDDPAREVNVRVTECELGRGVLARQVFPVDSVIGEIRGEVIDDPTYGSNYAIDLENGCTLEPCAPFRYLNHSCDPNCEFTFFEVEHDEASAPDGSARFVFLVAVKRIVTDEELTIDYNWPAESAIPCLCDAADCRGWIVAEEEVEDIDEL